MTIRKTQLCPCQARTFSSLSSVQLQSDAVKKNEIACNFSKQGIQWRGESGYETTDTRFKPIHTIFDKHGDLTQIHAASLRGCNPCVGTALEQRVQSVRRPSPLLMGRADERASLQLAGAIHCRRGLFLERNRTGFIFGCGFGGHGHSLPIFANGFYFGFGSVQMRFVIIEFAFGGKQLRLGKAWI